MLADAVWDAAEVERAPYRIVDLADDAALDAATARARRPSWARCGPATPATASTAAATSCAGCATTATGPRPRRSSGRGATGCGCCRSSRACRARSTGSCCPTVRRRCGRSRSSRCATRRRARWPTAGWAAPGTRRPADREAMRGAARRVGAHLQREHGYRGAFGIDGVLTADGFRPTELNTRMSAGATALSEVDRRFFTFLQAALVAGIDTGLTAADVEGLVPAMDAAPRRQGRRVRRGHDGGAAGELPGRLGRPVVRARRGGDRQPVPDRLRPERAVRQGRPVHRGGAGPAAGAGQRRAPARSSTRRTAPRSGRWSPRPTFVRRPDVARVVVVGGGFGGLASAARLAKLGHEVTLLERLDTLGGAVSTVSADGFEWDAGPTSTLLPAVIRDLFRKSGRPVERELELEPLDLVREHWFEDGTRARPARPLARRPAARLRRAGARARPAVGRLRRLVRRGLGGAAPCVLRERRGTPRTSPARWRSGSTAGRCCTSG